MESGSRQRGNVDNDQDNVEHSEIALAAMQQAHLIAWLDKEVDRCWEWLEQAMRRGMPAGIMTHTKDDLKQMLFAGNAQLWPASRGAMVTTVSRYPQANVNNVWLLGGDFENVMEEQYKYAENYAVSQSCSVVYIQGRPGWARRMTSRGFKECQRVVTKIL